MATINFNLLNGPQRRVLRETLMDTFQDANSLDTFLQDNGHPKLHDVVPAGTFENEVRDLILRLKGKGDLNRLVMEVESEYGGNSYVKNLEQLVTIVEDGTVKQRAIKKFAGGLEKMVRDGGFKDLNIWAAGLLEFGRRVCRISYRTTDDVINGTGFLVGKNFVLTNQHVIEPIENKEIPESFRLNFGYAETTDGPTVGQGCRLAKIIATAPPSQTEVAGHGGNPESNELDYALLQLDEGENGQPADLYGYVDLLQAAKPQTDDDVVFVLQHPNGKPLKLSIGTLLESGSPFRLRYDADTADGSSGALVLDQRLKPLALHHYGDPKSQLKGEFNQGIPLHLIRDALKALNVAPPLLGN